MLLSMTLCGIVAVAQTVTVDNIVYNDLIGKDYKVFIGKTKKGKIDFIA